MSRNVLFALLFNLVVDKLSGQQLFFSTLTNGTLNRFFVGTSSSDLPVSLKGGIGLLSQQLSDVGGQAAKPMAMATWGFLDTYHVAVGGDGFARFAASYERAHPEHFSYKEIGTDFNQVSVRSMVFVDKLLIYMGLWTSRSDGVFSGSGIYSIDLALGMTSAPLTFQVASACPDGLSLYEDQIAELQPHPANGLLAPVPKDRKALFWTDVCEGSIKSLVLDGVSSAKVLLDYLVQPKGLAFSKGYTAVVFVANYSIMVADLENSGAYDYDISINSTEVKAIVTQADFGIVSPLGLAVVSCKHSAEKVYWSDACTNKIQRSDVFSHPLFGQVEDVLEDVPAAIGLDIVCPSLTTTSTTSSNTTSTGSSTSTNTTITTTPNATTNTTTSTSTTTPTTTTTSTTANTTVTTTNTTLTTSTTTTTTTSTSTTTTTNTTSTTSTTTRTTSNSTLLATTTTTNKTSTTNTTTATSTTTTSTTTTTNTTITTTTTTTSTTTTSTTSTSTTSTTTTDEYLVCHCRAPLQNISAFQLVEFNEAQASMAPVVGECTTTTTTTATTITTSATVYGAQLSGGCFVEINASQNITFTVSTVHPHLLTITCPADLMPSLDAGNLVYCINNVSTAVPSCIPMVQCSNADAMDFTSGPGDVTGTECNASMNNAASCLATCAVNETAVGSIWCAGGELFGMSSCISFSSDTSYARQNVTTVVGLIRVEFILSPSLAVLKSAFCKAFGLDQFVGCRFFKKFSRRPQSSIGGRLLRGEGEDLSLVAPGSPRRLGLFFNIGFSLAIPAAGAANDANLTVEHVVQQALALADATSNAYHGFSTSDGMRMIGNITTIIAPRAYADEIATGADGFPVIMDSSTAEAADAGKEPSNYGLLALAGIGGLIGILLLIFVCYYIRNVRNKAII